MVEFSDKNGIHFRIYDTVILTDAMVDRAASSLIQAGYIGGMTSDDIPENAKQAARLALSAALTNK